MKIYIQILLLLFSKTIYCQDGGFHDSLQIDSIENLYHRFQKLVTDKGISYSKEIDLIITEWEKVAGQIEPILRVRILIGIFNGNFDTNNQTQYYQSFISYYHERVKMAKKKDPITQYNNRKRYLYFVPLNSDFDNWTEATALTLLKIQEKNSDEYLLCLLFSNNLDEFDTYLRKRNDNSSHLYNSYVNSPNYMIRSEGGYKVYLGYWKPHGKLADDFVPSFSFGAAFGFPIKLKYRAEAKLQVAFDPGSSPLEFDIDDNKFTSSDLNIASIGFRFTKVNKISTNFRFDISSELNVGFITVEDKGNNDNSKTLETIDIGLGLGVKRFIGDLGGLGIESMIHFAPYGLNPNLISDTGNIYSSTSFFFSF